MKTSTKLSALILASMMVTFSALAFGDPNLDPKLIITDPTSCSGSNCNITDNSFSFGIDGNTTLNFQNNSGNNWGSVLLTWVPGEPLADISVVFGAGFTNWFDLKFDSAGLASNFGITDPNLVGLYLFCTTQTACDIQSGENFTFNFAPDTADWVGTDFDAQAGGIVSAPEPGSISLLFCTVAFLSTRKKLWKSLSV